MRLGSVKKDQKVSINLSPVIEVPSPREKTDIYDASELLNFEAILSAFASAADSLLDVTKKLANVPFPLVHQLERVCAKESPKGAPQVQALFKMELGLFSNRLMETRPMLEDLQKVLDAQRAHNAEARDVFDRYLAAKEAKEQHDKAAEGLENRISPDGFIPEGIRKQIKDQRDSAKEFEQCTAAREKAYKKTLGQKWDCLKNVLSSFCRFYASAFKGNDKLVLDLAHLAEELTKDTASRTNSAPPAAPKGKARKEKPPGKVPAPPPPPAPVLSTRIVRFLRGSTKDVDSDSGEPGAAARRKHGVECKIEVICAKGLRDINDLKPDAYCVCEIPGKPRSKFQTDVAARRGDPSWGFRTVSHDYAEGDDLVFHVFHQEFGKGSADQELLGSVTLPSGRFYESGFCGELRLAETGQDGAGKRVRSKLEVKVTLTGKKPPEPEVVEEEVEEGARFAKGEEVMVWSSGQQAWLRGTVEEVFAHSQTHEGFAVQAGVIKVVSSAGAKYIKPQEIDKVVRKINMN